MILDRGFCWRDSICKTAVFKLFSRFFLFLVISSNLFHERNFASALKPGNVCRDYQIFDKRSRIQRL